jgi:hypothetical protein
MKKQNENLRQVCWLIVLPVLSLTISCRSHHARLSADKYKLVNDSVRQMTANIAADVSKNGPKAWLDYFEDTPDFFMANEGVLVFKDRQSAKTFILNTVVKIIPQIKLQWSSIRIDPLSRDIASIGADFHEDQVTNTGAKLSYDGYFTGVAHFDGHHWKLRNAHWSIKPTVKTSN